MTRVRALRWQPDARDADIVQMCREARELRFASVCVNPIYVARAKEVCSVRASRPAPRSLTRHGLQLLAGSRVKVCAVVGFPLGASTTVTKVVEAVTAVHDGADEVDMVIPVGKLKDRDARYVQHDIRCASRAAASTLWPPLRPPLTQRRSPPRALPSAVVEACHERGVQVKVILETCLLDERELISGVVCAGMAGADYVKTSTGFSRGGATVNDVALMHRIGARWLAPMPRRARPCRLLPVCSPLPPSPSPAPGPAPARCHAGDSLGLKVKASGGVGSAAQATAMLRAGASRLGASRGVRICEQSQHQSGEEQARDTESAY